MGVFALSGELRRLGPYRLLAQLATGGMGVVYLGRDPASGRIVAVKTLMAPGGVSTEARRRFGREVRLARRVRSTHTARVLDADTEAELPWMAMEYIPAPSLEALVVQQGPLEAEDAVRWIAPGILRALAELHSKGIVHRDVKPLNILLTADRPKVIDFGISHASDLTSTRLTLGTIAFTSPEQADGQPSSAASDIYAFGVTLYYLACGRLPYPETQEPLQQLNYVRRGATSLSGLPEGLTGLIGDCLAVRPEDRPTAEQLIRRFVGGGARVLPSGWTSLINQYAEEGSRLQRAADQAEAETVTRSWTSGAPGRTRRMTQEPPAGNGNGQGRRSGSGSGSNQSPRPGRGSPGSAPADPATRRAGQIATGVAVAIGAVILAAVMARSSDTPPDSGSASSPQPTYSSSRLLPDNEAEHPTGPPSYDTGPTRTEPTEEAAETEDASDPTDTDDGAATDRAPAPNPPRTYYGAIAVGRDGSNGESWDYGSRSAAERGAMSRCSGPGCKILVSFHDGCGAVAYNPNTNRYVGALGTTRAGAEQAALSRAGGGRPVAWACTRR
ncbi:protein kinase [Streptomyces oryzae]|uniref:non-specific serine/threonine protein kinase n=2 Tax=Streptomyces oryzae TaxID=1434886 RepID=A0ABS3X7Q3_9ACTN|nr:protein kinase [Streptomyces oryzae]